MNLLTGLFRAARKRVMTTDNDMGMFRQKLDELVASKDSLSDEEVVKKVEELKGYTSDLPGEGKAKIDRFLEDFKSIKEQDEASAKEAAGMVADLFEKLDTEAMQDVPVAEEEAAAEEPAETTEPAAEEETVTTEEIAEETEIPAEGEKEAEDADPNPEYTLEEIYQFCKKRREEDEAAAADASACDSAEEVEEAEEEEEKDEEEVVTDHAPFIPVTINQKPAATGTLASMFAEAKKGR